MSHASVDLDFSHDVVELPIRPIAMAANKIRSQYVMGAPCQVQEVKVDLRGEAAPLRRMVASDRFDAAQVYFNLLNPRPWPASPASTTAKLARSRRTAGWNRRLGRGSRGRREIG